MKIYNNFTDKFGNIYQFDNYEDFAKFWFNLPTSYARASFSNFKELQKASAISNEAKTKI